MMTRLFRDISTNTYMMDLVINAQYPDGSKRIEFAALITSGRADLEMELSSSLHPDVNKMAIALLPKNTGVQPYNFEYVGTYTSLLQEIKKVLLKLNRLDTSLQLGLSFTLDDKETKLKSIIKGKSNETAYQQVISKSDHDYAKIEDIMNQITKNNNDKSMETFGEFIYDIIVERNG